MKHGPGSFSVFWCMSSSCVTDMWKTFLRAHGFLIWPCFQHLCSVQSRDDKPAAEMLKTVQIMHHCSWAANNKLKILSQTVSRGGALTSFHPKHLPIYCYSLRDSTVGVLHQDHLFTATLLGYLCNLEVLLIISYAIEIQGKLKLLKLSKHSSNVCNYSWSNQF